MPRGTALPGAALALGLLLGALHPLHRQILTESTLLVAMVAAIAVLGGQLGALWWLGYVAADLLLFRPLVTPAAGWPVRL